MRASALFKASWRHSALVLTTFAALLAPPSACTHEGRETARDGDGATPARGDAAAGIDALAARFPTIFGATATRVHLERTPGGGARSVCDDADRAATIELPARADGVVRVTDDASRMSVGFSLAGAEKTAIEVSSDLAMYPGAAPSGGSIVHRAGPSGTEDFVLFEAAPRREELVYRVDVGGVAGLRLVAGTLEFLDAGGVPALRVAAPYVIDAGGARREASLSLEGCAADKSPRAPFGRAVTPPGADACTVKVAWRGVRYPAIVDPVWGSTTNSLTSARVRHSITLLNPTDAKSLVLLAGGFSTVGGTALKSAEIYDPLSRRFTATGNMIVARGAHSATLLTTVIQPLQLTPPQPVLIAGGADSTNTPLASLEVYDPLSGTFVNDPGSMSAAPRFEHTATLFADGAVLLAGGTTLPLNQPTNSAYEYTFTSFVGSPPTGVQSSLVPVASLMASSRTALASVRLKSGSVLLTGGFVLAGGALQALQNAEVWDPATKTFGAPQTAGGGLPNMSVQRGYHTATLEPVTGQVLLVGGLSKTPGGIYTNTVDFYSDGLNGVTGFVPQGVPVTMTTGRSNHTATLLTTMDVLVAGGFTTGGGATSTVEVFSFATKAFSGLGAVSAMFARGDHGALLVNAGDSIAAGKTVLVTGGAASSGPGAQATASAQILIRINGDLCTQGDECLSGFCSDGVCCDTACTEDCFSCTSALKEDGSPSGACGATLAGTTLPVSCYYDQTADDFVEVHNECDGQGHAFAGPGTHSCKPGVCGGAGTCSDFCDTGSNQCASSGWCDFGSPLDGGAPGTGTCQPKKPVSSTCAADVECSSANCVDGLCCDLPCKGQCQACDLPGFPGKCLPVGTVEKPEDPHLNANGTNPRSECAGVTAGVKTGCAGACKGDTLAVDVCKYPDDKSSLSEPDCKDEEGKPSTLTTYPCDGAGANTTVTAECAGFKCEGAHACRTTCARDEDCIQDHVCLEDAGAKVCTKLTGPLCDGDKTLRKPKDDGGYTVCPDHYACPAGADACLTKCDAVADCVDEYVCNGKNVCVTHLDAPVLSSGTTGGRPSGLAGLALAAAALALARRKRRSA